MLTSVAIPRQFREAHLHHRYSHEGGSLCRIPFPCGQGGRPRGKEKSKKQA